MTVLPNILGFALGGYAVLLGFGDEKFRKAISGSIDPSKRSPYLLANAAFVHFMLVLALALLIAVAYAYRPFSLIHLLAQVTSPQVVLSLGAITRGVGVVAFIYALILILPVTINLYRLAETFDVYRTHERQKEKNKRAAKSPRRTVPLAAHRYLRPRR